MLDKLKNRWYNIKAVERENSTKGTRQRDLQERVHGVMKEEFDSEKSITKNFFEKYEKST